MIQTSSIICLNLCIDITINHLNSLIINTTVLGAHRRNADYAFDFLHNSPHFIPHFYAMTAKLLKLIHFSLLDKHEFHMLRTSD